MLWVRAQLPTLAILRAHALLRGPKDLSLLSGRAPAFTLWDPPRGSRKRLIRLMKRFPSSRNYLQYKGFGALTALGPRPDEIRNPLPQIRI